MCGCSGSPVLAPLSVNKAPKQLTLEATDCHVTEQDLMQVKASLINARTPENTQSVNQYIGYIDTMFNTGNYCLYPLNNISL